MTHRLPGPSEDEKGRHPHQIPAASGWHTWLMLGGRGSGKTYGGAMWVAERAQALPMRFALVGPTFHDVREVMVEGASGLKAMTPPGCRRPRWEAGRRRLLWDSGAEAHAFSAEDPDSLRGPQFHAAWADEFCAWRRAGDVLSNLRMGLRLGRLPQLCVTTTPRPTPALRALMAEPGLWISRAATSVNADNLSGRFLTTLQSLYGGTRLAAQELEGLVVEDTGAMFRAEDLARARGSRPVEMEAVIVAVDPPASAGGDACGMVVAGRHDGRAYVLADLSERGLSPGGWARKVAGAVAEFGAARVVAEKNQGGEMVRTVLAQNGVTKPVTLVHAAQSKVVRAAPVAALYEQGRVVHCDAFPALEEELMALGGEGSGHSPDRADALVWAVTDLLVKARAGPSLRRL